MDDKNMKSTENYLDNLLNSMNGRPSESDDAADTPSKTDTSSQDDFLRKFEKELESDAYDEYISDFERDLENDAFSEKQTGIKYVQMKKMIHLKYPTRCHSRMIGQKIMRQ